MASKKAPELNRDNFILAIEEHFGNIRSIAQHFGKSRPTIYNFIGDDAELKQLIEDAREHFIEFAEGALVRRINADDTAAIIFALKTRGKNSGYAERTEHTGANGGAIQTQSTVTIFSDMSDEELDNLISEHPTSERGKGASSNST